MPFVRKQRHLNAARTRHLHPNGVGLEAPPRVDHGVPWTSRRPDQLADDRDTSGTQRNLLLSHIEATSKRTGESSTERVGVSVHRGRRSFDGATHRFRWLERCLVAGDLVRLDICSRSRHLPGLVGGQRVDFRAQPWSGHGPRLRRGRTPSPCSPSGRLPGSLTAWA